MKVKLLIGTALVAGLAFAANAKAASVGDGVAPPKDPQGIAVAAATKKGKLHFSVKGVAGDDDGDSEGAGDDSGSGESQEGKGDKA